MDKKFHAFIIFFVDFQNFTKIKICWRQIFVILSIYKPSLRSCEVPQNIWAGSVKPFIGYKQRKKQANKKSLNIDYIINKSYTLLSYTIFLINL